MERVKINKAKNSVLVSFNENFYNKVHIDQAKKDYGEVCEIQSREDSVILKPKNKKDIDKIGYEFYNYVLGLMKNS